MRVLVQRVKKASVHVEGALVGEISQGLLAFVAVHKNDTESILEWAAQKLVNLRIFSDLQQKMNLSLMDVQGSLLIVSQFTLYGDCKMGRRPSFIDSLKGDEAKHFYEKFISETKRYISNVQTGIFGAEMEVALINDGPVTLLIEK